MKIIEMNEPQKIDSAPSVSLIITDENGEIKYLATVSNTCTVEVLKTASKLKDYPVEHQDFQLDSLGQEIYKITDNDYFGAIVGTFLSLSWETSKSLLQFSKKEGLKFTLAINY